jgi:hypothetical protein
MVTEFVAGRKREIAIRLALGASPRQLAGPIVVHAGACVLAGLLSTS